MTECTKVSFQKKNADSREIYNLEYKYLKNDVEVSLNEDLIVQCKYNTGKHIQPRTHVGTILKDLVVETSERSDVDLKTRYFKMILRKHR